MRAGVQQLLRTGIGMRQQALAAAPSWPRDEVMTLPNALSLSRIALGPAVAWAVSAGDFGFGGMPVVTTRDGILGRDVR